MGLCLLLVKVQGHSEVLQVGREGRDEHLLDGIPRATQDDDVLTRQARARGAGADADVKDAALKVGGLEEGELVLVGGEGEGLGRVLLEREVHRLDARGGDIVERRRDAGQQVRAPELVLRRLALGHEDGLVVDVDLERLGVARRVKDGRLDVWERDHVAEVQPVALHDGRLEGARQHVEVLSDGILRDTTVREHNCAGGRTTGCCSCCSSGCGGIILSCCLSCCGVFLPCCLSGGCVALSGCLTSLLIIVCLGVVSTVVLVRLLCLVIFGGLSIGVGIGIGISISIASGGRTVVVLVVSGPGTSLGVLRTCGGCLSSLVALLDLSVAVRNGNVGSGARVGRRGAGILLDGA